MGLLDGLGARRGGGMSPIAMAVLGLLAYRTIKNRGGLASPPGGAAPGRGGLGGGLGGLLAGGGLGGLLAGGGLSGGLQDLLDRFRQGGLQQKSQSWVSTGANEKLEKNELEQALGEDRIAWLVEQTGLPRDELLTKLSGELPAAIDELTPEGRIPTDDEIAKRVGAVT